MMEDRANHLHRISVPTLHGFKFVEVNDIVCCTADGSYTQLYMKDKKQNLFTTLLLKDMELILHRFDFMVRVHKSHIINLNCAVEYINGKDGEVILENNMRITVSRIHKKEFFERMGKG